MNAAQASWPFHLAALVRLIDRRCGAWLCQEEIRLFLRRYEKRQRKNLNSRAWRTEASQMRTPWSNGYDNWPTITYLSTFYLTLLTWRHIFFGSWESMQISHETLVTFTLWSLAQASIVLDIAVADTWRRRILQAAFKEIEVTISDWKSFSTSFPKCVSLSLFFGRTCSQILPILQLSKGKCSFSTMFFLRILGDSKLFIDDSNRPKEQCREVSCHAKSIEEKMRNLEVHGR